MAKNDTLKAGFTGELDDKTGIVAATKNAAEHVKAEAVATARSAQDHAPTLSVVLLAFGAATFFAGYLLGAASNTRRKRYW